MCTYITEKLKVSGSAKGTTGWFQATEASVYFDHPVHAPHGHTLNIDIMNPTLGPSSRVALELTSEAALALAEAIKKVLDLTPRDLRESL